MLAPTTTNCLTWASTYRLAPPPSYYLHHHTGADGLSHCLLSDEDPSEEDDFEDWLDNSYSFSITLLNDRTSPYGEFAHFSTHLPGSLMDNQPVHCAPYNTASPTHSHSPSATPNLVLVITDSASHHNDPAIPHTVKACAKDDQINWIHKFLQGRICPPGLSDSDCTTFINVAACFFLLYGSLYHQEKHGFHELVIPVEHCHGLIREVHNSLRHKGVFQSGLTCCCASGGPCWLTTSNGTYKLATSAKFTKLPSYTFVLQSAQKGSGILLRLDG